MLKHHVEVETEMLRHVEEEMEKTDDDALQTLFQHISDDEKKHCQIMEEILKRAYGMGP